MTKTWVRFFSISDYAEEETWLREQHKAGWKLVKISFPGFYLFESCNPEDVIYRLDFKNGTQTSDFMQMCGDFGWEYFEEFAGWLYFRKPASVAETKEETELFSDDESKLDMISRIIRCRMLPILVIFFSCIIPNAFNILTGSLSSAWWYILGAIFTVLFVLYLYLFIHCGRKLNRLKNNLKRNNQ